MDGVPISDKDKIRIASDYILHAPPGEFTEVFNDVRMLIGNDVLLRDGCVNAFAQYNKDQFQPVDLGDGRQKTLITPYNEVQGGRFVCPKSRVTFAYDHMRREANDLQPTQITANDAKVEPFRHALQACADAYMENHYSKSGVCTVFGRIESGHPQLTLCIESHGFQPKNFWNGRWRSQWAVVIADKQAELKGLIKVQVHYYEDGNVQLVSSKDISRNVAIGSDAETTAKEVIRIIDEEESNYQTAVHENYTTMSETTFKALRRQLPITRTKFDWNKVQAYRVGQEINKTE